MANDGLMHDIKEDVHGKPGDSPAKKKHREQIVMIATVLGVVIAYFMWRSISSGSTSSDVSEPTTGDTGDESGAAAAQPDQSDASNLQGQIDNLAMGEVGIGNAIAYLGGIVQQQQSKLATVTATNKNQQQRLANQASKIKQLKDKVTKEKGGGGSKKAKSNQKTTSPKSASKTKAHVVNLGTLNKQGKPVNKPKHPATTHSGHHG